MITDFPTAPLASGLREAGGGTVEKSFYASHTEILTLPPKLKSNTKLFQRSKVNYLKSINLLIAHNQFRLFCKNAAPP